MFSPSWTEAVTIDDDSEWDLYPRRRSFPLKMLAIFMYFYTVAIGVALIVASDELCDSVLVATTVLVVWAALLTMLILGQTREGRRMSGRGGNAGW